MIGQEIFQIFWIDGVLEGMGEEKEKIEMGKKLLAEIQRQDNNY